MEASCACRILDNLHPSEHHKAVSFLAVRVLRRRLPLSSPEELGNAELAGAKRQEV
jgi:hypothetical protein